ncbi:hypothetical protein [Marinobacterium stanieri]|nr:hypothetical protein [Marinobacterium stanieri]
MGVQVCIKQTANMPSIKTEQTLMIRRYTSRSTVITLPAAPVGRPLLILALLRHLKPGQMLIAALKAWFSHPFCRTNTPPVLPSIYLYNLKQTKVFAFVPIFAPDFSVR